MLRCIEAFLNQRLKLTLHQDKVIIRKWNQGIDFLGYVFFPHHKILRTKTRKRTISKIYKLHREMQEGRMSHSSFFQSAQSYLGMLKHCRGNRLKKGIDKLLRL